MQFSGRFIHPMYPLTMLENGLPTRDANMKLLRDLLGTEVIVRSGKAPVPYALAELVDDEARLLVLCAVDLPLSAYMASALPQLPKSVAEECVSQKKLDPSHLDNVREVINIVSSLFNEEKMPHVRLRDMATVGSPKFAALSGAVATAGAATHHEIAMARYGTGTMSFYTRLAQSASNGA